MGDTLSKTSRKKEILSIDQGFLKNVSEVLEKARKNAKTAVNRDGGTFAFLVAAVLYLMINFVITMVFKKLETKYEF